MNFDTLKIKKLMFDKKLNNKQLAEKMDVSRQWLGVVLKRGYATFDYVNKLAKALDCEIEDIVKMEE